MESFSYWFSVPFLQCEYTIYKYHQSQGRNAYFVHKYMLSFWQAQFVTHDGNLLNIQVCRKTDWINKSNWRYYYRLSRKSFGFENCPKTLRVLELLLKLVHTVTTETQKRSFDFFFFFAIMMTMYHLKQISILIFTMILAFISWSLHILSLYSFLCSLCYSVILFIN